MGAGLLLLLLALLPLPWFTLLPASAASLMDFAITPLDAPAPIVYRMQQRGEFDRSHDCGAIIDKPRRKWQITAGARLW